jgi:hypothetical protein
LVNARNIIIALLIITAGIFAVRHFTAGEEERVKERFALLAERSEKRGEEAVMKMALRVRGIGALFDESSLIESSLYDLTGRYTPDNINSLAAAISTRFKKLSIEFHDIRVAFPEKGTARVSVTMIFKGVSKVDGLMRETHELDVELSERDKQWYFSRISMVEVLER